MLEQFPRLSSCWRRGLLLLSLLTLSAISEAASRQEATAGYIEHSMASKALSS